MCTRIMLFLHFLPSTFVHLKINCHCRWSCSIFHWYQTKFHRGSIPKWILVEYHWCQKVYSSFSGKGWLFLALSCEYWISFFTFLDYSCSYMFVRSIAAWLSSLLLISQYMIYIFLEVNQASLLFVFFALLWMRSETFIMPFFVFCFFSFVYLPVQ